MTNNHDKQTIKNPLFFIVSILIHDDVLGNMAPTSNSNEDTDDNPDSVSNSHASLKVGHRRGPSMDSWYVIDGNTVDDIDSDSEAERYTHLDRIKDTCHDRFQEVLDDTSRLNFRGELVDILLLIHHFQRREASNRIRVDYLFLERRLPMAIHSTIHLHLHFLLYPSDDTV